MFLSGGGRPFTVGDRVRVHRDGAMVAATVTAAYLTTPRPRLHVVFDQDRTVALYYAPEDITVEEEPWRA